MAKRQTHKLGLARVSTSQEDEYTTIERYRFEMDVVVVKEGQRHYAEITELGSKCCGVGSSVANAIEDFAIGFMSLVDLYASENRLEAFIEANFPDVRPSTNQAKFDIQDDSLIPPWILDRSGMSYALAA